MAAEDYVDLDGYYANPDYDLNYNDDNLTRSKSMNKLKLPNIVSDSNIKNNKFYVGSHKALVNKWGKKTLVEAVKHAKKLVDSTGEDQFVVQIVVVVKKQQTPTIVKKV